MKFRDTKTGEVFETICAVYERFCGKNERCSKECPLAFAKSCSAFVWEHQREAARLMGYEVVEDEPKRSCFNCWRYQDENFPCSVPNVDRMIGCSAWEKKEVNMEKKDKPRLAEVLGVEVGERFRVPGNGGTVTFWVTDAGYFDTDPPHLAGSTYMLLNAINHPESIIRAPRLTEKERAICKAVGAKWVSRDEQDGTFFVNLWTKQPDKMLSGVFFVSIPDVRLASVYSALFPSLKPGDCICVEEAGK